jgi:hypothetical protein
MVSTYVLQRPKSGGYWRHWRITIVPIAAPSLKNAPYPKSASPRDELLDHHLALGHDGRGLREPLDELRAVVGAPRLDVRGVEEVLLDRRLDHQRELEVERVELRDAHRGARAGSGNAETLRQLVRLALVPGPTDARVGGERHAEVLLEARLVTRERGDGLVPRRVQHPATKAETGPDVDHGRHCRLVVSRSETRTVMVT